MEVTYNWRDETDIRGFGSQSSFEAAANVRNRVDSVLGKWQIPSYLGQTGLDALIARAVAPNPEVFLLDNATRPPMSDQFSLGVGQRLGRLTRVGVVLGVRSRNGFTFLFGDRRRTATAARASRASRTS